MQSNDTRAVGHCSFNRTLWRVTGAQIGREARAMMNAGNGFSSFWAPVINLAREPRWGRNIEVCLEYIRAPVKVWLLLCTSLRYSGGAYRGPDCCQFVQTPGEDPYLTGEYAIYYTKGMQSAEEDPYHIQASACCKHYVISNVINSACCKHYVIQQRR